MNDTNKKKHNPSKAINLNNIAKIYLENKEYNYALALFLQAVETLENIKEYDDNFFRASTIIQCNIGITYEQLSEYNAALAYYDSAINNLTSIQTQKDNDWRMQAKIFQSMGALLSKQKLYKEAIIHYSTASSNINCIHKKSGEDLRTWAKISQSLSNIQIKTGQFKSANFSFRFAVQKIKEIHKEEKNSQDLVNWSMILHHWLLAYNADPSTLQLTILSKQLEIFKETLEKYRQTLLNAGTEHEINQNLNPVIAKTNSNKPPSIIQLLTQLQKTTSSPVFSAASDPNDQTSMQPKT